MNGFLLVHKPCGVSSFKMVHLVRKASGQKKVGHAGTLDPFASGLLILGLGKAFTRQIDQFQALPKQYLMRIVLGLETDTLDAYGRLIRQEEPFTFDPAQLPPILDSFIGHYEQTPPKFSAKKINGERAYKLARKNIEFELKKNICTIHRLSFIQHISSPYPQLDLSLDCSKGTYARSIGLAIAEKCQTTAYTKTLIRTKIGPYSLNHALTIDQISEQSIAAHLFTDPPPNVT